MSDSNTKIEAFVDESFYGVTAVRVVGNKDFKTTIHLLIHISDANKIVDLANKLLLEKDKEIEGLNKLLEDLDKRRR